MQKPKRKRKTTSLVAFWVLNNHFSSLVETGRVKDNAKCSLERTQLVLAGYGLFRLKLTEKNIISIDTLQEK